MNQEIDISVMIETPTGWLELEDEANGYTLGADSFASSATTHRKTEINSEWMEGTFVSRAVRENVTETVAVYVSGDTPHQLAMRLEKLTDGFNQLSYAIVVRSADIADTWSCWVSDYTVATKTEMRHATIAMVTATIPRLPGTTKTKVYP